MTTYMFLYLQEEECIKQKLQSHFFSSHTITKMKIIAALKIYDYYKGKKRKFFGDSNPIKELRDFLNNNLKSIDNTTPLNEHDLFILENMHRLKLEALEEMEPQEDDDTQLTDIIFSALLDKPFYLPPIFTHNHIQAMSNEKINNLRLTLFQKFMLKKNKLDNFFDKKFLVFLNTALSITPIQFYLLISNKKNDHLIELIHDNIVSLEEALITLSEKELNLIDDKHFYYLLKNKTLSLSDLKYLTEDQITTLNFSENLNIFYLLKNKIISWEKFKDIKKGSKEWHILQNKNISILLQNQDMTIDEALHMSNEKFEIIKNHNFIEKYYHYYEPLPVFCLFKANGKTCENVACVIPEKNTFTCKLF